MPERPPVAPSNRETQELFSLSIHRAFVVRLHGDFDPLERVSGLVEHVVSSACGEFHSIDELFRFMRRILDGHEPGRS